MKCIIEKTKYFSDVKEYARWTVASELNRFIRDGEKLEDYRAAMDCIAKEEFYAATDWVLSQQYDEYCELNSNTCSIT